MLNDEANRSRPFNWLLDSRHRWLGLRRDAAISILFALATFAVIATLFVTNDPPPALTWSARAAWLLWTIVPPAYFVWEWLTYPFVGDNEARFQKMKYSHDMCSKFWLAGVGVISVVLVLKDHDVRGCLVKIPNENAARAQA